MLLTGWVFDIQKFSIHDGPGIRTTVFLKGCPMRCAWCHNPEGITRKPVLSFLPARCIGCGYCLRTCEHGAHKFVGEAHVLDRELCEACGRCAEECFAGALELIGREASVGEVLTEVLADRPFYETSGGGMTLSGGEPLMQIDFAEALLKAAKDEGLHNVMETCGLADWSCFERTLPLVDMLFYDIKDTDPRRHLANTGVPLGRIRENLVRVARTGKPLTVRVPLIPGLNDFDDNLEGVVELAGELERLDAVEIMPYHALGADKHARIGSPTEGFRTSEPTAERINRWIDALTAAGVRVLNERRPAPTTG